jgi:hypothetical protein
MGLFAAFYSVVYLLQTLQYTPAAQVISLVQSIWYLIILAGFLLLIFVQLVMLIKKR